jgi:CheY-like chemotaxis protein
VHERPVLVIEDDFDVRDALTDILTDAGLSVVCAKDGSEAMTYLESGARPRLILLDLMMPGMDGYQFLSERRDQLSLADVPVVILSADRRGARRWRELGADGCLTKPVELDELMEVIRHHP